MEIEKKGTQDKKKLLYQLESIVTHLYPNHTVSNPYESYLESYYQELNIEDVLLFKRLLKSITILNHKERIQEGKRYASSYGDILLVIELMSNHMINDVVLRSYVQIKDIFMERPFTILQAQRILRKSYSTIKRYLKIWTDLKLILKKEQRQGKKHTYTCIGYIADSYQEEEGSFDTFYE